MSPSLRALLALVFLCFATTGCEMKRVLTVRPDGSGEIQERMLAPRDSYGTTVKPGEGIKLGLVFPTAEAVGRKASEYGEGVEVTSYKKIEVGEMTGYEAVYAVPDVTKLNVDKFLQREIGGPDTQGEKPDAADPVRKFQFTKGPVSELRMALNQPDAKAEESTSTPEQPQEDPKQREAFAEAIKHVDVRIAIRVQGTIEATNSHFRKENEVVVWEMNLKGLAADPKYADAFKPAAGKELPKEPPADDRYVKHEEVEVLSIRFR